MPLLTTAAPALETLSVTTAAPGSSPRPVAPGGGSKPQEVDEYMASLTRHGFLAAPPAEFLALLTDWRSPRTATQVTPADR